MEQQVLKWQYDSSNSNSEDGFQFVEYKSSRCKKKKKKKFFCGSREKYLNSPPESSKLITAGSKISSRVKLKGKIKTKKH